MSDLYGALVSLALVGAIALLVMALSKAEERMEAERKRWETERGRLLAAAMLAANEHTAAVAPSVLRATDPEPAKPKAPSLPIGL